MTIANDKAETTNRLEKQVEKVYEIYIKTTPDRLWKAITDPEMRSKYSFGNRIKSDWKAGSRYEATNPGAPGSPCRGREPRGRPAAPAGPDDEGTLG